MEEEQEEDDGLVGKASKSISVVVRKLSFVNKSLAHPLSTLSI
jgi:hypothetical protein